MLHDKTHMLADRRRVMVLTLWVIGISILLAVLGKYYSIMSDLQNDIEYAQAAADEAQRIAEEAKSVAEDAQLAAEEALSNSENISR